VRYTAAIVMLLVIGVSLRLIGADHFDTVAGTVLLAYAGVFCLLLPFRVGLLCFFGFLGVISALNWVNEEKIALTQLPLTGLDIKIAASYPAGLLGALGAPQWLDNAILPGECLLILVIVVAVGSFLFYLWKHFRSAAALELVIAGLIVILCLHQSKQFVLTYLVTLQTKLHKDEFTDEFKDAWKPEGLTRLSRDLGVLPFLAFSAYMENTTQGDFYDLHFDTQLPPSSWNILRSTNTYVDFSMKPSAKLPNIVIVLAESTFDPNLAFRLRYPVESGLFTSGPYTQAQGPLLVNAVGGGTWITEFETITGLDSRLFGYSGYYTHSSLSPFVKNTLATYLSKRGYRTSAYYPHSGAFYNGRRAYQNYGFAEFFDNEDLGRPPGWKQTDVQIIDTFIGAARPTDDAQFFSYILLAENHSPHPCRHFSRRDEFFTSFAGSDDWQMNCSLNEYILRLRSTDQAMRRLTSYMETLEKTTGRPFVILIFGDHQPHTFTTTKIDYGLVRTDKSSRETFFHVLSSAPQRLKCCVSPVPTSLLPTLISAFVALNPEDIYLGVNFYLYNQCGSEIVTKGLPIGVWEERNRDSGAEPHRNDACTVAYKRTITAYHRSGIMRYNQGSRQE
jgi:hypothetical protein